MTCSILEQEYYAKIVSFQIDKSIGRWVLESVDVYNPLSGVTSNQSEGFNTVLKQYQHWKEVPIDSLVYGLYRLQQHYYNEWLLWTGKLSVEI